MRIPWVGGSGFTAPLGPTSTPGGGPKRGRRGWRSTGLAMNVKRLVCRDLGDRDRRVGLWRRHILRYQPERDRHAVVAVATAATGAGPQPRPDGLLAELVGRPGRAVTGWLAWLPSAAGGLADGTPAGLVTLVESPTSDGLARWSISWLVVHPSVRGQGLGRALVATAVGRARAAGADAVWAETSVDWPAAAFWRAVGFEAVRPDD